MTTVVMTPKKILADRRVTSTITVKDQQGNDVKVKGTSDEYSKLGDLNLRGPEGIHQIDAYAIFGDIPTAEALVALVKAARFDGFGDVLAAVGKFNIKLPKDPTGICWVNEVGGMGWLIIENGEYKIVSAPVDTKVVAFGSGKDLFEMKLEKCGDVLTAFTYALKNDPLSSDTFYDHYDVESGVTSRIAIETIDTPTLETLLPVLDATS